MINQKLASELVAMSVKPFESIVQIVPVSPDLIQQKVKCRLCC